MCFVLPDVSAPPAHCSQAVMGARQTPLLSLPPPELKHAPPGGPGGNYSSLCTPCTTRTTCRRERRRLRDCRWILNCEGPGRRPLTLTLTLTSLDRRHSLCDTLCGATVVLAKNKKNYCPFVCSCRQTKPPPQHRSVHTCVCACVRDWIALAMHWYTTLK